MSVGESSRDAGISGQTNEHPAVRRMMLAAFFFQKYFIPCWFLYYACRAFSRILDAGLLRNAGSVAGEMGIVSLEFAVVGGLLLTHVGLFFFNIFSALLLFVLQRPRRPPRGVSDILVALVVTCMTLAYHAIEWLPLGW